MKTQIKILITTILLFAFACSSEDEGTNNTSNNNVEVTFNENPTTGDLVTALTSNLSGDIIYTLTSQSISNAFTLDGSSGDLRVAAWQVFDFESNPTITATATATNGSDTENKIIVIHLNNIDDIWSFLNDSRPAYENATNGDWIKILENEYNNLANYLENVTKTGQSDGMINNSNSINIGGSEYTVSNNNGMTMTEGSYLYAFKYYTNQNNSVDCKVKISETSHQNNFETVGSVLPTHDSGYNYFVLKASSSPTSDFAYLGIYESNTIGYKTNSASTYFYESGDAEDLTNDNNTRTYLYQGLSTTVKQWD